MGESPARYRRERQLDIAADWLLRTNLPVQEVALRAGFASGRQLTKMFRHFRGRSPLEFRRKKRAAGK
jgi:transcriptional regulator GlxA family with amidase domain